MAKSPHPDPVVPPLALRSKRMARALDISPRHLAIYTKSGLIPHLRLGNALIYPVADVARALSEEASRQARERTNDAGGRT